MTYIEALKRKKNFGNRCSIGHQLSRYYLTKKIFADSSYISCWVAMEIIKQFKIGEINGRLPETLNILKKKKCLTVTVYSKTVTVCVKTVTFWERKKKTLINIVSTGDLYCICTKLCCTETLIYLTCQKLGICMYNNFKHVFDMLYIWRTLTWLL